jgi:lysine-specific demethylase 8
VDLLKRQASTFLELGLLTTSTHDTVPTDEGFARRKALLLRRLEDILWISHSRFYVTVYKDVPLWVLQLYTDASTLKFCFFLVSSALANSCLHGTHSEEAKLDDELSDMVKIMDHAVILSGAPGQTRGRAWIGRALSLLEECVAQVTTTGDKDDRTHHDGSAAPPKRAKANALSSPWDACPPFSTHEPFTPPVKNAITRCGCTSVVPFQNYLGKSAKGGKGSQPLAIPGLIDDWPARTTNPWCKPAYLLSRTFGGRRLVPIELGRSYVDDDWGQQLLPFRDFLSEYVDPSSSAPTSASSPKKKDMGYLAQHDLLAQIPSLRADVRIPDLCYTVPAPSPFNRAEVEELDEPKLNAWFGPPGTITPLHTDPYHNLLVQVVGRKYVRLYGPWEGERLRPMSEKNGISMDNTSCWDVGVEEGWDDYPSTDTAFKGDEYVGAHTQEEHVGQENEEGDAVRFKDIPFVDCILEPGDTLYIPVGWWHYVRGLSVSFSVSFWWN